MKEKDYEWHKVVDHVAELDFSNNEMAEIEVNGKTICISRRKDELRGCTHKCPHAGGRLSDGYLDALGNLVCPLHRYKFSLHNGRNVSGEGYFLKTYPISIREDGVFVAFEKKMGFNW